MDPASGEKHALRQRGGGEGSTTPVPYFGDIDLEVEVLGES